MDTGGFVVCPYNSKHRVPRLRIQNHIIKCQATNPKYEICPYNATHRFLKEDLKIHVQDCPSKEMLFPEDKPPIKTIASLSKPKPIFQKEYPLESDPDDETWDD